MSKRSAQGPQGDKDTDLFQFNMSSTPDDKPQRATAAQMAHRRIKDVRRRTRPAGTASGTTGASFGGPFSSIDPNTVTSTPAGAQPTTNGFSFGQSQSFPGARSNPKPPTQNGGSSQFAFGSGGGSSVFNFSSSFGGAATTPASNPFASLNTGSSQQPDGGSFSGFKGSMFNIPSTGTQSPAQQPLPSGNLFGTGSQGGLFGNPTSNGPQSGTTTLPNGNLFGQSSSGAPSTSIFTQSGIDKPNHFAQGTAFSSDSMQTSPDAKSAAQKQSMFGSGTGGFGVSTNFGSPGTNNLFGGTTSAPAQTPSKPLFGAKPAEQAASASTSLFGATTQPNFSTSAAPSSIAAPAATGTSSSSLFTTSTSKPVAPLQSPFQSTNLFGVSTPPAAQKPSEEKGKEEIKASEIPSQPQFKFSSTPTTTSLFSKSETPASAQSSGLFQPPSTGGLFPPKTAFSSSTQEDEPKPSQGNPFSNLFVPKPVIAEQPNTEQKPLPSSSLNTLFTPKLAPSEGAKTDEPPKAAAPASPFSVSTPVKPSTPAPQTPGFSISTPQTATWAPTFTPSAIHQSPLKVNGANSATAASSVPSTPGASQSFDKLQPTKMPSTLDENTKEDVQTLYRVRMLNECFRREVTKLDPTNESFDTLVQFYLRVRETIGAPIEVAGSKRKISADSNATNDTQPSKKVKPLDGVEGILSSAVKSSAPTVASPSEMASSSQLFGTSQSAPTTGNKRKASEDSDSNATSTSPPAKRASGNSTTASIFASSFSRSKTFESDETTGAESPKKLDAPSFNPSTSEPTKSSLFSTTPTSSPQKPLFSAPTATKETSASASTPSQPLPTFKPTFTAPASSTPPANPFVLKLPSDQGASTSTASMAIPKFGSGSTDFFAQFKAKSDKEVEKEKEKRKAEDFDSEEEDEAEWERKDAEKQRKRHEEIEAQKNRRAKFVPGQGFSFEEENDSADAKKSDASPASSTASTSVFDAKPNSLAKSNIFGHLSATPSENGENEIEDDADDTEEASESGDDAAKEPSFAPTEEDESSKADSKANGVSEYSPSESSDEGDFAKALKRSKQADSSDQTTTEKQEQGTEGRSLFDRVQYGQDGKPKRQNEDNKSLNSIFGSSKYASSFNSPASTPNPFVPSNQSQTEKRDDGAASKPAPSNIFGSATPAGNIFGASTPATSGASTPSIFGTGSSATKPGTDNTWKINTPIKFSTDAATGAASNTKSDSGSAAPSSDSSKPFSTLFGAPSAGSKSGSDGSQPTLGFSFGGPSQPGSSFLTPSGLTSATPSRASTPGVASDTGASESADGDTAESLPQVDLARGGAGEENEDVVFETRARGLKLTSGDWVSQGVGFLRILKDRTTSRGRVLLRADPSGKVVLNANLMKEITYAVSGNSIRFLVPQSESPPESWVLRVKKEEAEKLGSAMEETKS